MTSKLKKPSRKAFPLKWLSTITEAENPKEIRIEKMGTPTENGNPQPDCRIRKPS